MDERLVFEVQRLYPQIYLACHADHVRASSTSWRLSSHDSSVLAHLSPDEGTSPRDLARHLNIAASTLSATLKRLAHLGYISNVRGTEDKRRREIRLTDLGCEAIASASVLDSRRVRKLLANLSENERGNAVEGLALLARAARAIKEEN